MVNLLVRFDFQSVIGIKTANNKACPDQYVGMLNFGKFQKSENRKNIEYFLEGTIDLKLGNTIAVILESPHKKEYDCNNEPIGPAMGTTGRLFEKKVDSLIRNSNIYKSVCNKKYSVVLLNAIQYQCSLGGSLNNKRGKEIRDNNWNLCFENPDYNDIVKRIEAINPCLVINLCTKGLTGMQSKLEEKLYNEILLKYNKIKYAKGTHPSTWNFGYAFMKMVV